LALGYPPLEKCVNDDCRSQLLLKNADKLIFLKFNLPAQNYSCWMCNVICGQWYVTL